MPTFNDDAHPPIPKIHCIGVIGAGQMGGGIATVAAFAGHDVRLLDVSQEQVEHALERIRAYTERQVQRGRYTEAERSAALARIKTGTDYDIFRDCQLVIEAEFIRS